MTAACKPGLSSSTRVTARPADSATVREAQALYGMSNDQEGEEMKEKRSGIVGAGSLNGAMMAGIVTRAPMGSLNPRSTLRCSNALRSAPLELRHVLAVCDL